MENQVRALLAAGFDVDIVCIPRPNEPFHSVEEDAHVYRVPALEHKREGKLRYFAEYATFFLSSAVLLSWLHLRRPYHLVHVHNLPDFLVFAALAPKILGAKTVLDLRECTPELYHCKYGLDMESKPIQVLKAIEQAAIRFADGALTCTEQMRQGFVGRGSRADRVGVMLNACDDRIFRDPVLPEVTANKRGFHVVTHGTITKRYGHEFLIHAIALVADRVPGLSLEIIGSGEQQGELQQLVQGLHLEGIVRFAGFVPIDELLLRLRAADCGVVSLPLNAETDLIHTYKMQEYMALGIPVIISRTRAVEHYFDDSSVCFFDGGSVTDLARAIVTLYEEPERRRALAANALAAYERYAAPIQKQLYLQFIQAVLDRRPVYEGRSV